MRLLVRMERPRTNLFATRLFWVWSLVTLLPLVGIFFSESLLVLTRLELSWAMPIRRALRHSVFWHLGFWDGPVLWQCSYFFCAAVFLIPPRILLPDSIPELPSGVTFGP